MSQKIVPHRNVVYSLLTLSDGLVVNWDLASGMHATVTLAGNRTMAFPTNVQSGMTAVLHVLQDAPVQEHCRGTLDTSGPVG